MKNAVRAGATVILLTCVPAAGPLDGPRPPARPHGVLGAAFTPARPCHGGAAADFDGNGVSDHAIGAPYATVAGRVRAGAVAVSYGGHVSWLSAPAPAREAGFGATLVTGDFNGDHCDDLAVGVPGQGARRPGADGTGVVALYYGSP